jgi:RNA polymerase sigma-70 factor (ECF subfamily)
MAAQLEDLITTANSSQVELSARQRAFGELVNAFQRDGYRYAYSIVGDAQLAQDVTQEAFLIAYQRLYQLREAHRFPQWFKQIVRSQCNRATRKKNLKTVPIDSTMVLLANDDPAASVEEIDLRSQVMTALEKLPVPEQMVMRLFYLKEFSVKEIARALEIPVTTVKKRLQYARARMRESLCQFSVVVHGLLVQAQPCFVYQANPKRQLLSVRRNE